jgi:hypothetical protein
MLCHNQSPQFIAWDQNNGKDEGSGSTLLPLLPSLPCDKTCTRNDLNRNKPDYLAHQDFFCLIGRD